VRKVMTKRKGTKDKTQNEVKKVRKKRKKMRKYKGNKIEKKKETNNV
jgi:hypothetical protein